MTDVFGKCKKKKKGKKGGNAPLWPRSADLNCQMGALHTHRLTFNTAPNQADIITLQKHIKTQAHLTCFRWHLHVFFLHLGDNRTFHLTITEPSKSSNPVPEHWWASLIGFYWQVNSSIHRGNVSSASGFVLIVGFFIPNATASSPSSSLGGPPPGEKGGKGTWICFF